jgi:POT family proton-dependent oligopeptide transporter
VVAVETAKGEAMTETQDAGSDAGSSVTEPSMEEMKTLRRVSGTINWQIMTVTFVEFCERFSYYGTTAVLVYRGV